MTDENKKASAFTAFHEKCKMDSDIPQGLYHYFEAGYDACAKDYGIDEIPMLHLAASTLSDASHDLLERYNALESKHVAADGRVAELEAESARLREAIKLAIPEIRSAWDAIHDFPKEILYTQIEALKKALGQ